MLDPAVIEAQLAILRAESDGSLKLPSGNCVAGKCFGSPASRRNALAGELSEPISTRRRGYHIIWQTTASSQSPFTM